MRARAAKKGGGKVPRTRSDPERQLVAYGAWLERQPLAKETRRTYRSRVGGYLAWLAASDSRDGDPLSEGHARDWAVRDYKRHLKTARRAAPRSVNIALAAIDNFYGFVGLGPAAVRREVLPQVAPRALAVDEQRRLLRAAEGASARDSAIVNVLLYTGLRLSEVAALDVDDVAITARKGKVVVRFGKGDAYREVPANAPLREALGGWLAQRRALFEPTDEAALFLNRAGGRLSSRSIDAVIARLGPQAGLELSAHVLRHTFVTNLVRAGHDVVLVAELAGHRRLDTTRRYSLPSAADREAAMESLAVEP